MCARTAVIGAYFNVRINAKDIKDKNFTEEIVSKAKKIYKQAIQIEKEIIAFIDLKM